jgi:transcriptional regulator with XRE-family HTH domain
MIDFKPVIAKNISDLRKSKDLTQTELALKLNYSDKAVSKWERAESIPDINVIKEIADIFQVTVDYLLEETHLHQRPAMQNISKMIGRNRLIIALLSASSVFMVATILYVITGLSIPFIHPTWMVYIYAIPIAFIVLLVFNSIWGRRSVNFIIITLLLWSILLCLYLSLNYREIWLVFIIGIPAQIIILLSTRIKLLKYKKD